MHTVELYAHVRRYVMVEGHSRRAAAREYGISREMVAKIVAHAVPPRYQRSKPPFKPKLDPFLGFIDEVLMTDQDVSRKQRHTARRIFERLQKEHGYSGGHTQVIDHVRTTKRHHQEMFIPLIHPPGHVQVDFGEAWVRIPVTKSLDNFDFQAIPSLNKPLVPDLARGGHIDRRENLIAIGNSGTGKSHLALGLGMAACQRGYSVLWTSAAALVNELVEVRDEKRLLKRQRMLTKVQLLIVDELGFMPLSKTGAELLFEIFSQRHERASTLVISNLPFDEWTEVFGSQRLTGALWTA